MALMMTIDNDDDDEQRRQGGQSSSESCVWMKDGMNFSLTWIFSFQAVGIKRTIFCRLHRWSCTIFCFAAYSNTYSTNKAKQNEKPNQTKLKLSATSWCLSIFLILYTKFFIRNAFLSLFFPLHFSLISSSALSSSTVYSLPFERAYFVWSLVRSSVLSFLLFVFFCLIFSCTLLALASCSVKVEACIFMCRPVKVWNVYMPACVCMCEWVFVFIHRGIKALNKRFIQEATCTA